MGRYYFVRKMRHSCNRNGCFLEKHVLKFGVFDGIFPRGINFSDVDASLEYNYQFLEMEWKQSKECITKGQTMYIKRKTAALRCTFIIVIGDAEKMTCTDFMIWYAGKPGNWIEGNIEDLKNRIAAWRDYVERRP